MKDISREKFALGFGSIGLGLTLAAILAATLVISQAQLPGLLFIGLALATPALFWVGGHLILSGLSPFTEANPPLAPKTPAEGMDHPANP